jgi:hypothetical protein
MRRGDMMGRSKWSKVDLTPELRERVVRIRVKNPDLSYRVIGERFGISKDLAAKRVRDAGAALPPLPPKQ